MNNVYEAHESEYQVLPQIVVSAPGRFHLIGEHSWFCKDKTLSMAVNLPVYVAVSPRDDGTVRFFFPQLSERKKVLLTSLKYRKEDRWANGIKAMIYGFTSGGFEIGGMDITVYSDILPSAGFGITTAMKVGSAYAIRALFNLHCTDAQLLQVLERGNRLFLKLEYLAADNYTALYSKENSVVCTDYASSSYDIIPFSFPGKKILLTDARVPRVSVWNEDSLHQPENVLLLGELKERRSSVYGGWFYEENPADVGEVLGIVNEDTRRRLLCVMREHQCILEAQKALVTGSFGKFARAVNRSHESMRDLYNSSSPEVDWILKRLSEINPNLDDPRNPTSCGRITGKGFGRCVYTILSESDIPLFKAKLAEYERIFGFHPSCYEVEPACGVQIVNR
ncbi:MAG: galactokinase [Treponema sp.]|nr:galactokinase [Treponema sp.]